MSALLDVILPVFLVIGFGYFAVWRGFFSEAGVDGLMKFTQNFAIPCLLFRAISSLDLGQTLDLALLVSFYSGAIIGFLCGFCAALYVFKRPLEDCVVIGFCGLFSNTVMLGLPITERSYGADALTSNYAIIAFHAPFCYAIGITAMEIIRGRGSNAGATIRAVLTAMFKSALFLAILLGFAVNLSGLQPPTVFLDAIDMMIRAAIPAALFGLGGVLYTYRPEGDLRIIATIAAISLLVHPAVVWTIGTATDLSTEGLRSAVLSSAMAPGVNAYVFANLYGCAKRVAASAVLLSTALTILTAWAWLAVLP